MNDTVTIKRTYLDWLREELRVAARLANHNNRECEYTEALLGKAYDEIDALKARIDWLEADRREAWNAASIQAEKCADLEAKNESLRAALMSAAIR